MLSRQSFGDRVLAWYDENGRRGLPWQEARSTYRIWVSEVMLQQTQVQTVLRYFQPFVERFPDVKALGRAELDDVLQVWSGLGYYARARNLHRAAAIVVADYGGDLPLDRKCLQRLPGIGRSTAGAILALAADQRQAILDGNVKRVLCRFRAIEGWPGQSSVAGRLWALAERYMPSHRVAAYTQGMMDLGSMICTRRRPRCEACPLQANCHAHLYARESDFPWPRPRRDLPVRRTMFMLVHRPDGSLLLERRPPTGIWGGLWCFPECGPGTDPEDWCVRRFGRGPVSCRELRHRRHSFTHFRLEMVPVLLDISEPQPCVMEVNGELWYKHGKARIGGLPAPVAQLLRDLHIPMTRDRDTPWQER